MENDKKIKANEKGEERQRRTDLSLETQDQGKNVRVYVLSYFTYSPFTSQMVCCIIRVSLSKRRMIEL